MNTPKKIDAIIAVIVTFILIVLVIWTTIGRTKDISPVMSPPSVVAPAPVAAPVTIPSVEGSESCPTSACKG